VLQAVLREALQTAAPASSATPALAVAEVCAASGRNTPCNTVRNTEKARCTRGLRAGVAVLQPILGGERRMFARARRGQGAATHPDHPMASGEAAEGGCPRIRVAARQGSGCGFRQPRRAAPPSSSRAGPAGTARTRTAASGHGARSAAAVRLPRRRAPARRHALRVPGSGGWGCLRGADAPRHLPERRVPCPQLVPPVQKGPPPTPLEPVHHRRRGRAAARLQNAAIGAKGRRPPARMRRAAARRTALRPGPPLPPAIRGAPATMVAPVGGSTLRFAAHLSP
jgi:hypothetical protein